MSIKEKESEVIGYAFTDSAGNEHIEELLTAMVVELREMNDNLAELLQEFDGTEEGEDIEDAMVAEKVDAAKP